MGNNTWLTPAKPAASSRAFIRPGNVVADGDRGNSAATGNRKDVRLKAPFSPQADWRLSFETAAYKSAYSIESTSACKLASMIFSLTPTVPHSVLPSVDVISTRVRAAVPATPSRIRTL